MEQGLEGEGGGMREERGNSLFDRCGIPHSHGLGKGPPTLERKKGKERREGLPGIRDTGDERISGDGGDGGGVQILIFTDHGGEYNGRQRKESSAWG